MLAAVATMTCQKDCWLSELEATVIVVQLVAPKGCSE